MPWLGRWTAADPGGFVDGVNLYRYTRNNPVNGVDNEGYETDPPPIKDENGNVITGGQGNPILNNSGVVALGEGKKMSDLEAAQRKMTRAEFMFSQQLTKLRGGQLLEELHKYRSQGRGQDADWMFQKPAYEFSGAKSGVLSKNAGRFLDGFTDGAEESASFAIGLLPGTERESWKELAAGTGALIDLGVSANSIQLEYMTFGAWQASDASRETVNQFVDQVSSIDFSDPYVWGRFTGSAAVEAVGGKFTGMLGKSSKLRIATGKGGGTYDGLFNGNSVDDLLVQKHDYGHGFNLSSINKVGGCENCGSTAIATDAMLDGRPASALNNEFNQNILVEDMESFFDSKFDDGTSLYNLRRQMLRAGDGARGIIFGNRGAGRTGHYFNIVNQNGVIRLLDGQTGTAPKIFGQRFKYFHLMRTN